jgi:hypothetical protein
LITEKLTPQAEYTTLRGELDQSRKYVFERPLLIVGAGITLMTTKTEPVTVVVLPALMTVLLLGSVLILLGYNFEEAGD